ncbi:MAG: conjugal transfer protein TrbE [Gammaproteobacteria bacterium]|nr:conjugal transfer protein TrbE [Gammaproteobacteria bacterium]MBU1558716.1 conjugal transfer protein TrbE [Gammaproteobacteria bacterium]MBU1628914.1 conjugal transfer protein TrbE [Gammaproteobacteria bacterium]MBU1926911.1 conjugal transfer protein TrbE [Gammaproteobacteria bacterium]MBU2545739.1 conjugal transfer protein TrbE [Gammaproteobacteria bacterium]
MFNLSEYRTKADRLCDLLPWAALIAPGIVLNKDGSFQRTIRFRGPDLESSTEEQLISAMARLNNALKRFGSGWALYIEARRQFSSEYPDDNFFPDPVSLLIDAERREGFQKAGFSFESHYFLTLQYLPPEETTSKLASFFISHPEKQSLDATKYLENFSNQTLRFLDILKDITFEAELLNDEETLTYLHDTISTKHHPVLAPEVPMYLDAFLADTPLLAGIAPQLGSQHLRVISMLGFPATTLPALLDQLNHLPIRYRWSTRFIFLDKQSAESQLKQYKRRWFAKRKNVLHLLQEVFTKSESQLIDTAAVDSAKDADEAFRELSEDQVAYGYYTTTIVLMDEDLDRVIEMRREVERVINGLGFTTVNETLNAVEAWLSSLPGQAYANVRMPLLHSLNLAHLVPFSAVWSGLERDHHLNAPALMYVHTHGNTPFRWVNHIGDVGHQMVIGPTGAGKSVLLTMMALQFRRYQNAQIFVFDKGGSFLAATMGVGGDYFELGKKQHGVVFQPLARIDNESEKIWAQEWLQGLLVNEGITITPQVKQAVWAAITALARVPIEQRTLTGLHALLQNTELRQALSTYTLSGAYGHLLDSDHETVSDSVWQCYEMEELMSMPSVIAPILSYLFHRLESRFTGVPTLLVLDEAWLFLDHPVFAEKIRDWLKSLRKLNVSVIFATQSVEDALSSSIAPALLESCPARILLPNDRVLEPKIRASYEKLGLNERQLYILSAALPRRQYYYQSHLGNRLFDLELGPIAEAFCAASRKEEQTMIWQIIEKYGRENFLQHYLQAKQLDWVWDLLNEKRVQ